VASAVIENEMVLVNTDYPMPGYHEVTDRWLYKNVSPQQKARNKLLLIQALAYRFKVQEQFLRVVGPAGHRLLTGRGTVFGLTDTEIDNQAASYKHVSLSSALYPNHEPPNCTTSHLASIVPPPISKPLNQPVDAGRILTPRSRRANLELLLAMR
jgi:hypothetical protein